MDFSKLDQLLENIGDSINIDLGKLPSEKQAEVLDELEKKIVLLGDFSKTEALSGNTEDLEKIVSMLLHLRKESSALHEFAKIQTQLHNTLSKAAQSSLDKNQTYSPIGVSNLESVKKTKIDKSF